MFDSAYSRLLGKTAYELVLAGTTGVMATCFFQDDSVQPCGLPLGALLTFDEARGRWVIKKPWWIWKVVIFMIILNIRVSGFCKIRVSKKPRLDVPRRFYI